MLSLALPLFWGGCRIAPVRSVATSTWDLSETDQRCRPVPDRSEVLRGVPLVIHREVEVDDHGRTAFLKPKGVPVSLGGIGKGCAIGRPVEMRRYGRFRNFMIQTGGDMYVAGRRGERAGRLGTREPRADRSFATLDLSAVPSA